MVGGFNRSEKYSSIGMIIPKIWKNKSHVPNHQPEIYLRPLLEAYFLGDISSNMARNMVQYLVASISGSWKMEVYPLVNVYKKT